MLPDIPKSQRTEHCITQGVDRHIAIRVRVQAKLMGYAHPGQVNVISCSERMYVKALPYTELHDFTPLQTGGAR